MKKIHVVAAGAAFDVEVPAEIAETRAAEIASETDGIAVIYN